MSISELGTGFLGDPDIQFVELRLDGDDQTDLTDTRLTAFDKDGLPTDLLLTPSGVPSGASGGHVLYATAAFQAATGVAPDFLIPSGIVSPSGMVCWGAPGDTSPPDPAGWDVDKPNNYVDCVAYGAYQAPTRLASGTPTSLAPGDGVRALTRTKNNSVTGSNDTDFALATASPCNNAGQCAVLAPTPARAVLSCRRTIVKASSKLGAARVAALVGCESARLRGKLAGPCPDAKTTAKLAVADARLAKTIVKACGALGVADTGFGSACPGFTGACTAPIASIADVVGCVGCAGGRAADELTAALHAAPPDVTLRKCQLALGKVATGFFRAATALLTRCEDAVARGTLAPPCPDAKTAAKLLTKEAKIRSAVCRACGGKDKRCDGVADAAPAPLGLTTCPARTVPGGAACGAIAIADLGGVVECAVCLARFESRCASAVVAHPSEAPSDCITP